MMSLSHTPSVLLTLLLATVPAYLMSAPCTCSDLSSIKRRLQEADVAIAEYNILIRTTSASAMTTETEKDANDQMVQTALNTASYTEPPLALGKAPGGDGPAYTDGGCFMHFTNTASACMLATLRAHEEVHRLKCEQLKSWGSFTSWQLKMTMHDFMRHETDSYNVEKAFLKTQLLSLQSCPGTTPTSTTVNLPAIQQGIHINTLLRGNSSGPGP